MDHTSDPTFNTAGLFTPGRLGPYTLPHRMLMAPMTRNRARRDGVPSPSAVIYYAQRASAAMIVTETTTVSEQAVGYPLMPGIHTADQVAGWRPVVDAVHRFGCRFFLQLFHAGRVSHPSLQPGEGLPVAPSPIAPNGQTPTYQGPTPFVRRAGLRWRRFRTSSSSFASRPTTLFWLGSMAWRSTAPTVTCSINSCGTVPTSEQMRTVDRWRTESGCSFR